MDFTCALIIPALNEEKSIGKVLAEVPDRFKKYLIVVDNGSTDKTAEIAKNMGGKVLHEKRKGYGSACLKGLQFCKNLDVDFIAFIDADYSDYPQDLEKVYQHIIQHQLDLVIGSRTLGLAEPGALLPQARFGNWLAGFLMSLKFDFRFSDLGPLRIIRKSALDKIEMQDTNFGWTIEMQIKALSHKLKVGEVSVGYKKRIGISKITGTLNGTIKASIKILYVLFKYLV